LLAYKGAASWGLNDPAPTDPLMAGDGPASFHDHFRGLADPRVVRTRRHPLIHVVCIAVCGVRSGAHPFAGIQEFGGDRRSWFALDLDPANRIPSDDTFARGLARLDPAAFERGLLSGTQAVPEVADHRRIAIDGKTLRGSYDRGDGKAAIPRASAWATENTRSLRQGVVDRKSNEITAVPELLGLLEVSGAVVRIEAMGGPKEIADLIRGRGGGDVLAVQPNRPPLDEQVEEVIDTGLEHAAAAVDEDQRVEKGHGRHDPRT